MRLAVATLIALFAFASPAFASQVTVHSVDNSAPSRAAGARTVYAIEFTATNGVANTARITVAFPTGTMFAGGVTSDVLVGTTDVGGCFGANGLEIECFMNSGASIASGTRVRVVLAGVTNASPSGAKTLTVKTTADADAAPGGFTVVDPGVLTAATLTNAPPSNAAGARTIYEAEFTTSATGGLSAAANSRITLTFPAGTTFTGGVSADVLVGSTDVGGCFGPNGLVIDCFLNTNATIAPGARVHITLGGITNPTSPGQKRVAITTTSDPSSVDSAPVDVVTAGTLTAVTLSNANPSNAAGARTIYEAEFTTSATGGLSAAANSRITLTFPAGTTFTGGVSADVLVGSTDVGGCFGPNGLVIDCFLNTNATIAPGARVHITLGGITNPTSPGQKRVAITTTSDPSSVDSAPVDVVTAGTLTAVTLSNANPSNAAGARTIYEAEFTTSATGGLSAAANSRITLTFPAGTTFTGGVSADVLVGSTDVGGCFGPNGLVIDCFLNTNATIAPGARVHITLGGITNPTSPGQKRVAITTTSDPSSVDSAPVDVVTAGTLSAVTAAAANPAASATTQYTIDFTTSSTGALSYAANSRITVVFAIGTTFPAGVTSDVRVGTTDVGGCFSPNGLIIDCYLNFSAAVAAGARVRVTLGGVRNPPTAGSYSVRAATTSDVTQVTSEVGTDTVAPETTLGSEGPSFTFSSDEPGSTFECAIDDGAFMPCESPFTPPALPPGEYTLSVRAVDAAGNRDPTPATRGFVVAQPPPTPTAVPTVSPTPTPIPEPAPQFNQTVVVEPAGGTVEVCPKGGKCFTLTAGQQIPMGSTVNTKKGAVELTSVSAPGAPKQTAVFSEGIFRISQRGAITELKLTEPLAPCSKRARAAAKKPKSRKLWGKGSGKFRTVGNYSAATIRGTRWLTQDSCAGTLTRVTEGVVSVRDNVKKKTVLVRPGKPYTAKPRR